MILQISTQHTVLGFQTHNLLNIRPSLMASRTINGLKNLLSLQSLKFANYLKLLDIFSQFEQS